ncbi:inositol monophosphatase family protein [Streptomyces sp. HSG2]|uniref:inositol monophosphatase family protein n=1 Tax=Streptomyces sp. HSG2 TaxID=2797167 RepID=UPI001F5B8B6B|nr:inositol monophosphatase family protein [Streptomyces sp. HSG2]
MAEVMAELSDLELAHHMADVATRISLRHFNRSEIPTADKDDGSPVSVADLEVDRALVHILRRARPADGILTEESGACASGRRRWILDPIDGTAPFLAGEDGWGTHIALEADGCLQLAVLTRPVDGRRWWAVRGGGAYASTDADPMSTTRRLAVTAVVDLASSRIGGFVSPAESEAAAAVARQAHWVVEESSPVVALLEGRLDAVLDEGGNAWDMAPGALLVAEAGGLFTDPSGGTRLDMHWGLYGGRAIHAALSTVLARHLPVKESARPLSGADEESEGDHSAAAT